MLTQLSSASLGKASVNQDGIGRPCGGVGERGMGCWLACRDGEDHHGHAGPIRETPASRCGRVGSNR